MKDFKDKVAVITGAASGIGRGLAEHCSQKEMKPLIQLRMDGIMEERNPLYPPMPSQIN